MPQSYTGPVLRLRSWAVTRRDLERVYKFLSRLFEGQDVQISLETSSREDKVYQDFPAFAEGMEVILSLAEEVYKIILSRNEIGPDFRRHAWVEIEFPFNLASFHIFAEGDEQASLRKWVQDAYDRMQVLVKSLETPADIRPLLERDFLPPFRRRVSGQGVVILDYDGNITARAFEELSSRRTSPSAPPPLWYRTSQALVVAILVLVLILNLLLFFR